MLTPTRVSAGPQPWRRLRQVAQRAQEPVRRTFIRAVNAARGAVSLSDLTEAVRGGQWRYVDLELRPAQEAFESALTIRNALLDTLVAGADAATDRRGHIRTLQQVAVIFDRTNPAAQAWVRQHFGALIVGLQQEQRRALRATFLQAYDLHLEPRATAKLLREHIGLTARQATAIQNRLASRLAGGMPTSRALRLATSEEQLGVRRRALTIARHETLLAADEGQRQLWEQARADGALPATMERVWIVTPDDRLCPACAPMEGKTAPLDGLYPGGFGGPPLHVTCRCAEGLQDAPRDRQREPLRVEPVHEPVPESPWPLADDDERAWTEGARDAAAALERRHADWVETLRRDDYHAWDAVNRYTGSDFRKVNDKLWANDSHILEPHITRALRAAPQPPPPPVVWRGITGTHEQVAQWAGIERLEPGTRLTLNGFQSTTVKASQTLSWTPAGSEGTLLEIVPKRGAYVRGVSVHEEEYEFLLEHGATYRVVGIKDVKFRTPGGNLADRTVLQLVQE